VRAYLILDLDESATEADVKKAHRRLALAWHPDKAANRHRKAEADAYVQPPDRPTARPTGRPLARPLACPAARRTAPDVASPPSC
jgi:hypothetical protein